MVEQNVMKEAHDLGVCIREVLGHVRKMHEADSMPNTVRFASDQCQFNLQLGAQCNNLIMNFNVYICGINSYLLNLVTMFPQDDFLFPEGSDESTKLFKVRGAPFLGAHNLDKPIAALSLDEAIEAALEYVHDNAEDIAREAMGAAGM